MSEKKKITVRDILHSAVEEYLKTHGYDGLYDGEACGCHLGDLFPCGGDCITDCMPGFACGPDGQYIGPSRDWMPGDDDEEG